MRRRLLCLLLCLLMLPLTAGAEESFLEEAEKDALWGTASSLLPSSEGRYSTTSCV